MRTEHILMATIVCRDSFLCRRQMQTLSRIVKATGGSMGKNDWRGTASVRIIGATFLAAQ